MKVSLSGEPLPREHVDKMGKYFKKDLTCSICIDLHGIANKPAIDSNFKPATISHNDNILIDTGALQSNYVHETVAMQLEGKGARKERSDIVVCSGVCGLCAKTSEVIYFDLTMLNECNDNYFTFPAKAIIVKLKYDLIIGRPDINLHNSLILNFKHFKMNISQLPSHKEDNCNNNDTIRN
jgi:hypothetical protein